MPLSTRRRACMAANTVLLRGVVTPNGTLELEG
jgi:hypothetical protein